MLPWYDIQALIGDPKSVMLTFLGPGGVSLPLDDSDWRAQARPNRRDGDAGRFDFHVDAYDAPLGVLYLSLTGAQTEAAWPVPHRWDLQGTVHGTIIGGDMYLLDAVTEGPVSGGAVSSVSVTQEDEVTVITTATIGPRGPAGVGLEFDWDNGRLGVRPAGSVAPFVYEDLRPAETAWAYVHVQATPETVWTIDHPLTGRPSVTVVDDTGLVRHAQVVYVTDARVQVMLNAPVSGKAYFS